ncbi:TonB-dependent receptor, partial [bacterium]|nr:TonB-dependent receptor [bacterium]
AKTSHRGAWELDSGGSAQDDWFLHTAGFRLDADLGDRDAVTLQADLHRGEAGQILSAYVMQAPYHVLNEEDVPMRGGSVSGEWRHTLSAGSTLTVEGFYERMTRQEFIGEILGEVMDLELRHDFHAGRHFLSWSTGLRRTRSDLAGSPMTDEEIGIRTDDLLNVSVQDEVGLAGDRLRLVLGAKYEHNDYTHNEVQPGVRLLWSPRERHRLWTAVSRAVRTPSRYEADIRITGLVIPPYSPANPSGVPIGIMTGDNTSYDSEKLTAYEAGYRFAGDSYQIDLSVFSNDYKDIRRIEIVDPVFYADHAEQLLYFRNGDGGRTYGVELGLTWFPVQRLRLDAAYTYLNEEDVYELDTLIAWYAFTPSHHLSLRAAADLPGAWELDGWLRTRGSSLFSTVESAGHAAEVEAFSSLDLRLAKRLGDGAVVEAVAQNLLAGDHLEFLQEAFILPTRVSAGWYLKATVEF